MRRELGNSDQALDLLPRDFRLVTSGLRHGNDREQYCEQQPFAQRHDRYPSQRRLADFLGVRPEISVLYGFPITRDVEPSGASEPQ